MTNKAFTMIEMLIVIALIWVVATLVSGFDFNRQTDGEKRDRMANMISSIINTEKINAITWKGVSNWSSIINYDYSKLNLSNTWLTVKYLDSSMNTVATWASFTYPFYMDTHYEIKKIDVINASGATYTWWTIDIIFNRLANNISFTGTQSDGTPLPSNTVSLDITAWYAKINRHILFDYRTWRLEIK
ncbi:MAG: hypothetical protein ACD_2C00056G0001 [uncultured bacterium (gcode 4)]|uniref:Prepilin-type N-terminal cleavage/methylation domain-containing protein n=1 Tax=uncultured bacterium (gcode 4) TaxID=1234023 RepID=K2H2D5_9BACT|nr:MAG: hypothetical protein ACD_2C00056G0001 [uncultured bacterium (gcode 4)]